MIIQILKLDPQFQIYVSNLKTKGENHVSSFSKREICRNTFSSNRWENLKKLQEQGNIGLRLEKSVRQCFQWWSVKAEGLGGSCQDWSLSIHWIPLPQPSPHPDVLQDSASCSSSATTNSKPGTRYYSVTLHSSYIHLQSYIYGFYLRSPSSLLAYFVLSFTHNVQSKRSFQVFATKKSWNVIDWLMCIFYREHMYCDKFLPGSRTFVRCGAFKICWCILEML